MGVPLESIASSTASREGVSRGESSTRSSGQEPAVGDPKVEARCFDESPRECILWAKQGECETSPKFMSESCRRSCKLCVPETATEDSGRGDMAMNAAGGTSETSAPQQEADRGSLDEQSSTQYPSLVENL